MFGKKRKKMDRKMRRRIRKTSAVMLLISAIVVAAIPVPEAAAAGEETPVVETETGHSNSKTTTGGQASSASGSLIPSLSGNDTVYCTSDNQFQFAYKPVSGYDNQGILVGNVSSDNVSTLVVPDELEAFVPYTTADGTNQGLAAANQKGYPLYYKAVTKITLTRTATKNEETNDFNAYSPWTSSYGDPQTETSANEDKFLTSGTTEESSDGKSRIQTAIFYRFKFFPCKANDKDNWNVTGVKYYIYNIKDSEVAKATDNQSSDYWTYYQPPTSSQLTSINIKNFDDLINQTGITTEVINAADNTLTKNKFFLSITDALGGPWLSNVAVGCISNQRADQDDQGTWYIDTNLSAENKSFFAGGGGVKTIQLPKSLFAIADYSFYKCRNLTSVRFDENCKIKILGESAFEGCTNLESFVLVDNSQVEFIGQKAFKDCVSLKEFYFPTCIETIGDQAFNGCSALASLNFNTPGNLTSIGDNVFTNCSALTTVSLPNQLKETGLGLFSGCSLLENVTLPDNANFNQLFFSDFEGCSNLKWIDVLNDKTTFDTKDYTDTFDVYDFKNQVGEGFYFIGSGGTLCLIRNNVTKVYEIAFMYRNSGNFEIVKTDKDSGAKLTYLASNEGELLNITIDDSYNKKFHAEIPASVGPYDIIAIGDEFQGNEYIESLSIPNTIQSIADNAFLGCSSLTEVEFEETNHIKEIGSDAFRTQSGKLTFIGEIREDSEPFRYAMDPDNTINNRSQTDIYIDFCSGAPTNLHVHYDEDREGATLWKVPTTPLCVSYKMDTSSDEYVNAIKEALKDSGYYEDFYSETSDEGLNSIATDFINEYSEKGTISGSVTPNIEEAVAAAFDIEIPSGVKYIAKDLFSKAASNVTGTQEKIRNEITNVDFIENAMRGVEIASAKSVTDNDVNFSANIDIRSITMHDIEKLDMYAFYGCKNLRTVHMYSSGMDGGEEIGDYAFGQCVNLGDGGYVRLPDSTVKMGKRPFAGDSKLQSIAFTGEASKTAKVSTGYTAEGDHFLYDNGIIFKGENGTKEAIVECLESKSGTINSSVLAGVSSIYDEAFMGSSLMSVDMSDTTVKKIPDNCFDNAKNLAILTLPYSCTGIGAYAMKDTHLGDESNYTLLTVMNPNTTYTPSSSFYDSKEDNGNIINYVKVACVEDSYVAEWVEDHSPYHWDFADPVRAQYTTEFYDIIDTNGNGTNDLISSVVADAGDNVTAPQSGDTEMADYEATHEAGGMYFSGWSTDLYKTATKDMQVYAVYSAEKPATYTITFMNDGGKMIRQITTQQWVPSQPTPVSTLGDFLFTGWSPSVEDSCNIDEEVTCNRTFYAIYDYTKTANGNSIYGSGTISGNNPNNPNDPNNPNGGNSGNNGSDGSNGNNGSNGSNGNDSNSNTSGTLYTLTVINGSGSGSYTADTQVTVAAYTPNTGYEFYSWTSSESDTNFTSKTLAATSFKMPAKNLTVTANYRTKAETGNSITSKRTPGTVTSAPSSNTGSTSGGSSSTGNRNNGSGNSVQVSRPGISNTDVASATVNGSTDNFVIRVTEDGSATMAVAEALRNEYGSLDNIHYFAMDISLYDESGTQKITDTSGLSVTVTLPIPDELRQYAGNNKVGAVTNGNRLEKLTPRFTTVNGVPCVTFTATHFSPYTIYVDTANLLAGGYDATPKTGDAIHPKWFLAIGLALFSAVLFLKKDKKVSHIAA